MKKVIFTLFAFLISLVSYSQELEYEYVPFPTSGVIWTEMYNPGFSTESEDPVYERFTLTGEDTVINEITYEKVYIFHEAGFDKNKAECIGGIREDEDRRIYYIGEWVQYYKPFLSGTNKEVLLFDFSVNVGDEITNGNFYYEDKLIVEEIDTIEIGQKLRKRIHFNYSWVKWIEGLGSEKGLLFYSGDLIINGLNNFLICFEQDGEILYMNSKYDNCWPVDNYVIKYEPLSEINISPNPVTNDILLFDLKDKNILTLYIYSSSGEDIENQNIYKETEFKLNTENYRPGLYFYKATDCNGKIYSGKFIVN